MRSSGAALGLLLALAALALPSANAVLFKMEANGKQCISEDAGSDDVIVHATYNVTSRPDPACRVDIRVRPFPQPLFPCRCRSPLALTPRHWSIY